MKKKQPFNKGDRVGLLHEKGQGTVTDIHQNLVTVELDDIGMALVFEDHTLFLIEQTGNLKHTTTEFPSSFKIPSHFKSNQFLFLIRLDATDKLACYLLNTTGYALQAQWFIKTAESKRWEWSGELKAEKGLAMFIFEIPSMRPNLTIRLQGYFTGATLSPEPVVDEVWSSGLKNNEVYFVPLLPGFEIELPFQKPNEPLMENKAKTSFSKHTEPGSGLFYIENKTFDLHAHVFIKDYQKMHGSEIVRRQIKMAEELLYKGMREKWNSLTLIHGIGTGVLKNEVLTLIRNLNLPYTDENQGGAVRVNFRGF